MQSVLRVSHRRKTILEAEICASYGAAVIVVHHGSKCVKTIGDIRLRLEDIILLSERQLFLREYRKDPAFYLVSNVEGWSPLNRDGTWISLSLFLA